MTKEAEQCNKKQIRVRFELPDSQRQRPRVRFELTMGQQQPTTGNQPHTVDNQQLSRKGSSCGKKRRRSARAKRHRLRNRAFHNQQLRAPNRRLLSIAKAARKSQTTPPPEQGHPQSTTARSEPQFSAETNNLRFGACSG